MSRGNYYFISSIHLHRKTRGFLGGRVNMILEIQKEQDNSILKEKSLELKEINDDVKKLAQDMIETMNQNNGLGLAACQVGKNIRLFVTIKELSKRKIFINPEIIKISKRTDVLEEGCLSVPEIYKKISRAKSLKIKALDEKGTQFKLKAKDLLERVIQHEIDHLNGKLIIDYE